MRTFSLLACTALLSGAGLLGLSVVGHAHPEHGGKGQPHAHADEPHEISDAQKEKRLERVIRQAERRQRNREQRSKDRRGHLKKRLGRHLKGADVTPNLVAELKLHAERTALLRQIRYVAATEKDYDSVVSADKVLARQNSNHEAWWRTVLRAARKKQ
jgi:hypothetical protein